MLALTPGTVLWFFVSRMEPADDLPWTMNNVALQGRIEQLEHAIQNQQLQGAGANTLGKGAVGGASGVSDATGDANRFTNQEILDELASLEGELNVLRARLRAKTKVVEPSSGRDGEGSGGDKPSSDLNGTACRTGGGEPTGQEGALDDPKFARWLVARLDAMDAEVETLQRRTKALAAWEVITPAPATALPPSAPPLPNAAVQDSPPSPSSSVSADRR